jgi:hypothetical protein
MTVWLSPWDWTATDWAGVQCIVLVVAAIIAFRQFVVVDFEVDQQTQAIYIVIANTGNTAARNVHLAFNPPLTSSFDKNPNVVPPGDLKPLSEGIPSLPPGKRLHVMFDMFTQRDGEAYPDLFDVHVSFEAPVLKRRLSDDTVIDLGVYRNVMHANRQDIHDVHARLKELVAAVKNLRASLPPEQKREPSG